MGAEQQYQNQNSLLHFQIHGWVPGVCWSLSQLPRGEGVPH